MNVAGIRARARVPGWRRLPRWARRVLAVAAALRAAPVRKLVIVGAGDPQMSRPDAEATARRIGAPPPVYVPGRHLTMIASPDQVAATVTALAG